MMQNMPGTFQKAGQLQFWSHEAALRTRPDLMKRCPASPPRGRAKLRWLIKRNPVTIGAATVARPHSVGVGRCADQADKEVIMRSHKSIGAALALAALLGLGLT